MPSKTLLATGDLLHEIRAAGELAIRVGAPELDFAALAERKRRLVRGWADYRIAGIETFPVFTGKARFESPTTLRVGDEVLYAPRFVIATGSVVAPAALSGLAEAGFIDSDDALDLEQPPQSLVVLGGGYVGSELGQFFHRAGVPTTIVCRAAHLLSGEDHDVGDGLTEYFREEGIRVESRRAARARQPCATDSRSCTTAQDGAEHEVAAHEILYALGRVPERLRARSRPGRRRAPRDHRDRGRRHACARRTPTSSRSATSPGSIRSCTSRSSRARSPAATRPPARASAPTTG